MAVQGGRDDDAGAGVVAPGAAAVVPTPAAAPLPFRQRHAWDCGIACVAAVTGGTIAGAEAVWRSCIAGLESEQVWTPDLVRMLHERGVHLVFTTTFLGANPAHSGLSFYGHVDEEVRSRVDGVVADLCRRGVAIRQATVPTDSICDKLAAGKSRFIALTDARLLRCTHCWFHTVVADLTAPIRSYAGHYVVLVGYDPAADVVEYLDPARDAAPCYITPSDLHAARTAAGTDEDLIEIVLTTPPSTGAPPAVASGGCSP